MEFYEIAVILAFRKILSQGFLLTASYLTLWCVKFKLFLLVTKFLMLLMVIKYMTNFVSTFLYVIVWLGYSTFKKDPNKGEGWVGRGGVGRTGCRYTFLKKTLEFLFVTLPLEILKKKNQAFTPGNSAKLCGNPWLGNFKVKNQDPWKFNIIAFVEHP